MFRSITFNGTDKKQIGAPIIRRTNEMISEFDLQYERNYKIVKVVSQRELEFQEYLKQQEALQYRLENLIKILREYFKENNLMKIHIIHYLNFLIDQIVEEEGGKRNGQDQKVLK